MKRIFIFIFIIFIVLVITTAYAENTILPNTGGSGTNLFYFIGGGLALGASAIIIARNKSNNDKN